MILKNNSSAFNIVVIGGGAGGLELVVGLAKQFKNQKQIVITLIDKSPIHLWKPLLHEAAAGTLNSYEDELSYYSLATTYQFQFILGTFQELNREKKEIYLAPIQNTEQSIYIPERKFSYDLLILAVGSISNDFNIPGVRENCCFLDTTQEALFFHHYLLKKLMQLPYLTPKKLDIAIIGGGATGVELVAELHYAVRQMALYGMHFDPNQVSFTLIEGGERLLPALSPRISTLVTEQLKKIEVKIFTCETVEKITEDSIITRSGKIFSAQIKVWAAGIKAPSFLKNLIGLETNNINQLIVKQTLQTTVDNSIFAIGDCASYYDPKIKKYVPPRAQASHQEASFLVKSIRYYLQGKSLPTYHYRDYGSLISLSHYDTIGNLMGRITKSLMIEGKFARFAYLSLYRMHQKALFGSWRMVILLLANSLSRTLRSRLKLH